jgi:hypothetical protein
MNVKRDIDARQMTLASLDDYLEKAVKAALVAQLCSHGRSLADAISIVDNGAEEELKPLFKEEIGRLHYAWLASNLKASRGELRKIDLEQYAILRDNDQPTERVYEHHLRKAQQHIRGGGGVGASAIRRCLNEIFNKEKITQALQLIGQIKMHVDLVERSIDALLAPPRKLFIKRWVAIAALTVAVLTLPAIYFWDHSDSLKISLPTTPDTATSDVPQSSSPGSQSPAPSAGIQSTPSKSSDPARQKPESLTSEILVFLATIPLAGYVLTALGTLVAALGVFFPAGSKVRKFGVKLKQAGGELSAFQPKS